MTLTISIAGLVIALATFVWQWRTWLYEGAKIRVTCVIGLPTSQPEGSPHYLVKVANVGRSPVELEAGDSASAPARQRTYPRVRTSRTACPIHYRADTERHSPSRSRICRQHSPSLPGRPRE
jgi:hypothetical protein